VDNLKEKTANGLFWGLLNSGSTQFLNLVIGIFLARLLTPADYGILGMITIFSGIASTLNNSGLSTALVNKVDATTEDNNSVFAFNIIVSAILYIILFFCAPLIADFFHEPALINLSRFMFLSLFFSAGLVPGTIMTKKLMVREKTIMGFVALVLSGIVGITLAFNGFAYWSLAWQSILYVFIIMVGCFYYTRWYPTFHFSFKPIKEMFGFSSKLLITSIINILNGNILSVIFGRLYNANAVGNFNQANKWNGMASSTVNTMVTQVAQPIFVSVREDNERQIRVFRKMLRFTSFIAFPVMFGLALIAKEFIIIAISEKWIESAILLQILCIGGAFCCFHTLYQNLLISMGKSNVYMWINILQIVLNISIVLACYKFGLQAMVIAFSCVNILILAAWQYVAYKYMGLSWTDVVKDIIPFGAIAAATMVVTYIVTLSISNIYILLVSRIVVAAVIYYILMRFLHVSILRECMKFIKIKL